MNTTDKIEMLAKSPQAYDLALERSQLAQKFIDFTLEALEPTDEIAQDFFWQMMEEYFKEAAK